MKMFYGVRLQIALIAVFLMTALFCQGQTSGKDIFTAKCVMCHAADGTGTPMGKTLNAANLRTVLVQKKSNAELSEAVSHGKGNMPAFGTSLSDDEIKGVIAYVRTLAAKKK